MTIYLTMLGMVAVTFAARALPLLLLRGEVPTWLKQWLALVPVAVFVALILPPLLLREGAAGRVLTISATIPAGIVGALVAWRWGNVLLTIGAGLATFWLLRLVW